MPKTRHGVEFAERSNHTEPTFAYRENVTRCARAWYDLMNRTPMAEQQETMRDVATCYGLVEADVMSTFAEHYGKPL